MGAGSSKLFVWAVVFTSHTCIATTAVEPTRAVALPMRSRRTRLAFVRTNRPLERFWRCVRARTRHQRAARALVRVHTQYRGQCGSFSVQGARGEGESAGKVLTPNHKTTPLLKYTRSLQFGDISVPKRNDRSVHVHGRCTGPGGCGRPRAAGSDVC